MDNEKTLDKLPVEMISYIFDLLEYEDLKVASSVCWSWYNVFLLPRFLKTEVISLTDKKNHEIQDVLKIYTKTSRPFLNFKICGLGVKIQDGNEQVAASSMNTNHYDWIYTVWPLLATKVIYLEFDDIVEFDEGVLPSLLNVCHQLKVLKFQNFQCSSEEELFKVNRIQSLKEIMIDKPQTRYFNNKKLLGIIPKELRKLGLKSMSNSMSFIEDLIDILKFCSSHFESLELIDIDLTPELMQSITSLDIKLKKFSLTMSDSEHYYQDPEIMLSLLHSQWPLIDLKICAECVIYEHAFAITEVFKALENLSLTSKCPNAFAIMTGIAGSSFEKMSKLREAVFDLPELKSFYIGIERVDEELY